MSLYKTLTRNTATSLLAIFGSVLGGLGGVLLSGGTGAEAAALGLFGSIAGMAVGVFAADKYTEFTSPPSITSAPNMGTGVAPTQGPGVEPAQDIGTTAMNALQSAPAQALIANLGKGANGITQSIGVGPGGMPLLKADTGRII